MADYRRVTRQCAADDWSQCHTHEDVVNRYGGTDFIKQFQSQNPRTWYSGDAPRERRRDIRPGQAAPGPRVIGQLKVTGLRNVEAIRRAVDRAERTHNTVIDIASGEIAGRVVHEHDEDVVDGVVIEEINERWLLLAKERHGGRPLTFTDALALAAAAYPDGTYPDTVTHQYSIRDGLLLADPATHYVFYAELA